ncbi:TcpE family conjugal transfer membrane protein, partial [Leuconostoc mesenteroides]
MAEVYNYQKALKQDIVIRKISDEYSLPVGISLKPAIIFFASVVVIYLILHVPLQVFYHANSDLGKLVYVGAYIAMPVGIVSLSNRVKPDGLGLVQYAISIATFGIKRIL